MTVASQTLLIQQARKLSTPVMAKYEMIKVERVGANDVVALITLNRPKALNALCTQLMDELADSIVSLDNDAGVLAIVITGSEKAFAAGADIKEMVPKKFSEVFGGGFLENWSQVATVRKPTIAAVNGHALGGGCEVIWGVDVLPGDLGGGVVGKSLAMKMCLTGEPINASKALQSGLVAEVFPPDQLVSEAIKLGEKIAANSPLMVGMAKQSVNRAYETTLQEGLLFERRLFHASFATHDRKEGMEAFQEKRKPTWQNS
ncbi:hypothetical protein GPALN_011138 [Globodera pallida]|nr:hypothetical protein GPALN_011138 [Globodera pallida]